MTTMIIQNNFHNTRATIRPRQIGGRIWISNAVAHRLKKALCGIDGCTCGGSMGERPSIEAVPDRDGSGWWLE